MSAKEASTFSNYIFSNFIDLHELGQNTTSKPDLICSASAFSPVFWRGCLPSPGCCRGWWIHIYLTLRCSFSNSFRGSWCQHHVVTFFHGKTPLLPSPLPEEELSLGIPILFHVGTFFFFLLCSGQSLSLPQCSMGHEAVPSLYSSWNCWVQWILCKGALIKNHGGDCDYICLHFVGCDYCFWLVKNWQHHIILLAPLPTSATWHVFFFYTLDYL